MISTEHKRKRAARVLRPLLTLLLAATLLALTLSLSGCDKTKKLSNFVQFEMEDGSTFVIELYPKVAPKTVANFKKLVSEGFYDGLTFHRIYPGFMIQGGDPNGNGTGGSSELIYGEFAANGFNNTLSHTRGVISMARRSSPYDSASSQFFIVHDDKASRSLDGLYAAFGKVIEGMDTIDAIAAVECSYSPIDRANTTPINPPVIKSVTFIDRK